MRIFIREGEHEILEEFRVLSLNSSRLLSLESAINSSRLLSLESAINSSKLLSLESENYPYILTK